MTVNDAPLRVETVRELVGTEARSQWQDQTEVFGHLVVSITLEDVAEMLEHLRTHDGCQDVDIWLTDQLAGFGLDCRVTQAHIDSEPEVEDGKITFQMHVDDWERGEDDEEDEDPYE